MRKIFCISVLFHNRLEIDSSHQFDCQIAPKRVPLSMVRWNIPLKKCYLAFDVLIIFSPARFSSWNLTSNKLTLPMWMFLHSNSQLVLSHLPNFLSKFRFRFHWFFFKCLWKDCGIERETHPVFWTTFKSCFDFFSRIFWLFLKSLSKVWKTQKHSKIQNKLFLKLYENKIYIKIYKSG